MVTRFLTAKALAVGVLVVVAVNLLAAKGNWLFFDAFFRTYIKRVKNTAPVNVAKS